ncbi:pimeloyl-ACP methyl ester carboxylesterase [Kibdelosporangium banguiense]|uniref:Pimeloyl-ACP methyl ester carboxylesterase n=1 Tax=Kibdelosporangium banguiense TaxID=1365924 RepID=A0ABS4TJE9_9PSEU|nr:alpha/beta hydrolase [Kibdelosporangium banguiense]MBP2324550.1 pimeloyl-ACP methyl ester carboxylesterase [Kibdelosporangium banguiense]
MAGYVTVNGVRSWYDVHGEGDPLVLLHGGFSDSRDFEISLQTLAGRFQVFLLDRRAHGRTPDVEGPVTLDMLADDVSAFIESVVGGPAHVAGYSSGGVVALALALRRPDLVRRLVLMNTGYSKDGWMFLPEPDGEFPDVVVDAYAEVSPDGRDHFPVMVRKFATMDMDLALDPSAITSPTLVLGADDDIVHLSHTIGMYQAIANAQLAILPGTSHLLLFEKPEQATAVVEEFLSKDPVRLMPIRHAAQSAPQPS